MKTSRIIISIMSILIFGVYVNNSYCAIDPTKSPEKNAVITNASQISSNQQSEMMCPNGWVSGNRSMGTGVIYCLGGGTCFLMIDGWACFIGGYDYHVVDCQTVIGDDGSEDTEYKYDDSRKSE